MTDSGNGNLPAVTNDDDGEASSTLSPYQGGSAQPGTTPYQAGSTLPPQRDRPSFEPPIEPDEGIPWGRYIDAIQRYKWLILLSTLLGTGIATVATRFLKLEYTAHATIWVETQPVLGGPIRPRGLLQGGAWQELLKTGAVLDSVALKQRLFLNVASPSDSGLFEEFTITRRTRAGSFVLRVDDSGERYRLETADNITIGTGQVGDTIGKGLRFRWIPPAGALTPGREIAFGVSSLRDVSNELRTRLGARMPKDGNFLRVTLSGQDPNRIAEILNAVTDQFVSVAAGQKQLQLSVQAAALKEQLEVAGTNLADAEARLQRYRIEIITLPAETPTPPLAAGLQMTQAPVMKSFFAQQQRLENIDQDVNAINTMMESIRAGTLSMDALLSIPSVKNSQDLARSLADLSAGKANLRALQQRFTDEHRLVQEERNRIALLREETIPPYVDGILAQLEQQRAILRTEIDVATVELQKIPERTITEQRLKRERMSAETLFQMLQNNYEKTKLSLQSAIPDIRLLDPALAPSSPSSNSAPVIILVGFLVGLIAATGLALLLGHLDKRFRYPEQVTNELGLTILGAVPAIRKLKNGTQSPEEASQVIEAFRTVRLALTHSYGTAGPIMLTVSSPGPGDGKSLVSSNLALSFAEGGYNTLLVDGDIRRGELHRMFDVDRQPGLLDYLNKDASLEDVIRRPQRGLSLISCGTRRHLGPELLGSPVMGELIAHFKTEFDVVIVDSPPLGAGIDPFILSTATGNLLLVLRSGETDRIMAEEKLKLADRLPIRILGAVLNDVQTKHRAYRYYNYVYGYTAEDGKVLELPSGAAAKD